MMAICLQGAINRAINPRYEVLPRNKRFPLSWEDGAQHRIGSPACKASSFYPIFMSAAQNFQGEETS